MNNDGFISNGDLFQVLKIMVGDNLSEVQLQQLVDRTIALGDSDFDGKLSFEEFSKVETTQQLSITVLLTMHSYRWWPNQILKGNSLLKYNTYSIEFGSICCRYHRLQTIRI